MNNSATLVHATAVAINGQGVLLTGPSGSGKSDLALRLIDRGAALICDDYCDIVSGKTGPIIRSKPNIAGMIEVRGVGIMNIPHVESAPLALALNLGDVAERLPDDISVVSLSGWSVPAYPLTPFEQSAPLKAEMLLKRIIDEKRVPVRLFTQGYERSAV